MATRKPINKLRKMETVTLTTTKKANKPGKEEPGLWTRLGQVLIGQDPPTKRKRAARKAVATRRKRSGK